MDLQTQMHSVCAFVCVSFIHSFFVNNTVLWYSEVFIIHKQYSCPYLSSHPIISSLSNPPTNHPLQSPMDPVMIINLGVMYDISLFMTHEAQTLFALLCVILRDLNVCLLKMPFLNSQDTVRHWRPHSNECHWVTVLSSNIVLHKC